MTSRAVDIGSVADFDEERPRRIEVDGRAVVIVRRHDEVFALRDICPHKGAPLSDGRLVGTTMTCRPGEEISYGRKGEILRCPWHGWEFDLATGRSLVDPERARVRSYPAYLENGRVFLDLG